MQVSDLEYNQTLDLLAAGTYGRGLWEISLAPGPASVVSALPGGTPSGPVGAVDFVFSTPMDTTSFSPAADVARFIGPGGVDLKPQITGYSWISPTKLHVSFIAQLPAGVYTMIIGPQVLSATGMPMDQDSDGIPGEAGDDQYLASFAITSAGGSGLFAPKVEYPLTVVPYSVTAADFDGDGKDDLAAAQPNNNTVAVQLNRGDGTFAPAVQFPTGTTPFAVVAADFNGDGRIDLATANQYGNSVSLLLNSGNGAFVPHADYAAGSSPRRLAAGDLNGDGKTDLAVMNVVDTAGVITVLLNNGNGTFLPGTPYAVGSFPWSVVIADFNGDARGDLAVANGGEETLGVLLNRGDGTFSAATTYPTGSFPISVASADFNHDGWNDLAVAVINTYSVGILLNRGGGAFAARVDYDTGPRPSWVTTGDFNGDGILDLATANYSDASTSVLSGNGDGTFKPKVNYAVGANPYSLATGRFNGDARNDLAAASGTAAGLSVLLSVDTFAPAVAAAAFVHQSVPGRLTFRFTENVEASLSASDISLQNLTAGGTVSPSSVSYDATTNTATFTFGSTLQDGNYRATLPAGSVNDAAGNPLGYDFILDFSVVAGVTPGLGTNFTLTGSSDKPVLAVTAGSLAVDADLSGSHPGLGVDVSGGAGVIFQATQHLSGLTLTGGATATMSSVGANRTAANHRILVLGTATAAGTLSIDAASGSRLDLSDNDLILKAGGAAGLASVQSLISSGYAKHAWNGAGIVNSAAAGRTNYALGYALNDGSVIKAKATFGPNAEPVGPSDVLVKYTYEGDSNLDGQVSFDDYFYIDSKYPKASGSTWVTGDFDYNAQTSFDDYFYIDSNYPKSSVL